VRYRFKTTPYQHQREAIKKLIDNGFGGALLMEPRTGKTKTTIDYLSILAKASKLDRAVVICPSRVMDVWVEEIARHSPLLVQTIVWDRRGRSRKYNSRRVATGPPPVSPVYDLTVLIVNFEAFATPGTRLKSGRRSKASGRFKNRQLIQKWVDGQVCAGIIDESHKIKSPSGRSSNMIVSMADLFEYRLLLTGTPVTKAKRIHDLYMQWKFLRPETLDELGLQTAEEVKNFTGVWIKKNGYPQWVREQKKNVEVLRQAIHADSYAIKRSDCFDLPPRDDDVVKFSLSRRVAKIYDDMAENMVAEVHELVEAREELEDLQSVEAPNLRLQKKLEEQRRYVHTLEASIRIVQNLRLSQITSGLGMTDEGKLIRIGREKIDLLHEYLDEVFEAEEKVVIAARFKGDLDACYKTVKDFKVPAYELRGGMKRTDATASIQAFKRREGAAAFIMQPQAGSLGIDLSSASRMIWYSLIPSWTDFTQSCDRIALSRKSTTFTYLIADGTYDEVLYDTLQTDGEVAAMITDRPEIFLRRKE
jgi:Mesyanzhinovviridae DNA helicase